MRSVSIIIQNLGYNQYYNGQCSANVHWARVILNTAKDRKGAPKHCKGPQKHRKRTAKDHKEPQRTAKDRKGALKDRKRHPGTKDEPQRNANDLGVRYEPKQAIDFCIIIIISLLKTHVRRTCLHSKNITMKHTRVILCYATDGYIGYNK